MEAVMLRTVLIASIFLCLAVGLPAGNRADVNADQAVNAADAAVLANILSGNLDAAGYNLANVVVVAPQGGDFTSPLDALLWVAGQAPSAANRFVVLVAPGEYTVPAAMSIPSYTTLRGYDRVNCRIIRSGSFLLQTTGHTSVAVQDLSLINEQASGTSGTRGVFFEDCTNVLVSNVDLLVTEGGSIGALGFVLSDCTGVRLEGVKAVVTALASCTGTAYGIYDVGADVNVRGCNFFVLHNRASTNAVGLYVENAGGVQPEIRFDDSILKTWTATALFNLYMYKASATYGWTRFFDCELDGTVMGDGQSVRWHCRTEGGVAVP
jgi:hypothetical protein